MNLRSAFTFSLAFAAVALAADAPDVPTPKNVLDNYKKLERVTTEPKSIGAKFAALCSTTPALNQLQKETGPHAFRYVNYYLNDAAQHHFASGADGDYPAGSVIVKEKLRSNDEVNSPMAVTGMIKGAPGSNPKAHDWQFFYFDRRDNIDASGQTASPTWISETELQNCAGCHSSAKDMVFGRFDKPYKIPDAPEREHAVSK